MDSPVRYDMLKSVNDHLHIHYIGAVSGSLCTQGDSKLRTLVWDLYRNKERRGECKRTEGEQSSRCSTVIRSRLDLRLALKRRLLSRTRATVYFSANLSLLLAVSIDYSAFSIGH